MLKESVISFLNRYLALSILLIFLLIGCSKIEKEGYSQLNSITTKDITFLRDSKGLPVAVKVVSELAIGSPGDLNYVCKLKYADELLGNDIDVKFSMKDKTLTKTITLINQAEGKLDVSRWKTCCDIKAEKEFKDITQTAVCSK